MLRAAQRAAKKAHVGVGWAPAEAVDSLLVVLQHQLLPLLVRFHTPYPHIRAGRCRGKPCAVAVPPQRLDQLAVSLFDQIAWSHTAAMHPRLGAGRWRARTLNSVLASLPASATFGTPSRLAPPIARELATRGCSHCSWAVRVTADTGHPRKVHAMVDGGSPPQAVAAGTAQEAGGSGPSRKLKSRLSISRETAGREPAAKGPAHAEHSGSEIARHLAAGCLAGVCEYTVCQPVDMVATRRMLVTTAANKGSIIGDLLAISRESGVVGLFRGLGPQLLAAVPATCGMYAGERFFAKVFSYPDGLPLLVLRVRRLCCAVRRMRAVSRLPGHLTRCSEQGAPT